MKIPPSQHMNELNNTESQHFTRSFVCIARSPFKEFFRLYVPIFDLLFVAIIPFSLMIFTNIGIIRTTMRSNVLCISSRKQQRNNRLTVMLLSVILAFMLLTCPSVIYICLNRLTSSTGYSDSKLLVLDLLESLWYTKHALNFILYTLSGQDFRREFIKLLPCSSKKTAVTSTHQRTNRSNTRSTRTVNHSTPMSKRPYDCQSHHSMEENDRIKHASAMIMSRAVGARSTDDMRIECPDGQYFTLSACSSGPTRTSTTSDQRRSSSATRTSIH
jgi:hypothetical protein